jgi:hypothetical protein
VVLVELRFQEFQKQNAVHPGNAQLHCHTEELFIRGRFRNCSGHFSVWRGVFGIQYANGVFDDRPAVAVFLLRAADIAGTAFPGIFQSQDVEQFPVELFVQAVAVVGKRFFEQVNRRKEFVEGNEPFFLSLPSLPFNSCPPVSAAGRCR